MSRTEKALTLWTTFIVTHPIKVLVGMLLFCGIFLSGLPYFDVNPSPRDYLGKEMPLTKHLIALEEEYVEDMNILLMIKPIEGDIFNQQTLAAIEEMTNAAWQLPYSRRVDSLTNFQHTYALQDDLIVENLVTNASQLGPDELQRIKAIALNEPALAGFLVAEDGGAAGINILFNIDLGKSEQTEQVYEVLDQIKQSLQDRYPSVEIYESGYVSMTNHWRLAALVDVYRVQIPAILIIFFGLIYFLGSIRATLAVTLMGVLAVVVSLGLLGLLKIMLTPASLLSCLMILVLGLADGIHIIKNVRRLIATGQSAQDAIVASVTSNFTPIALTSITTAIGFLTFNFTGFAGIKTMGNFVAFGVMFAFLLSISLLPAMLCFCKLKAEVQNTNTKAYNLLTNFVIRHRKLLLWLTAPAVAISIFCISLNEFDERVTRYLKSGYVYTDHLDIIQEELSGVGVMIYSFSSGEPGGVSNPEFIAKVESFVQWSKQQPEIRHVSTYTDTLKRLNFNLHNDDPAYYQLPNNKELAAQYLLLYEMSLPYGLDLTNQINLDKSSTRVVLTSNDLSLTQTTDLVERNKNWLGEHAPDFDATANSSSLATLLMAKESIQINVLSGVLALAIIGVILLFTFRSFIAGLLCVVCVISPMLVTYGLWGLTKGVIDMPASLTVCMVIGLAVDFSVHFVTKYVYAQRQLKKNVEDSVRYTFMVVSAPIVTSTIVLGCGYAVLAFSIFQFNAVMGQLTALCILFSAIATFLLIPSILLAGQIKIR